MVWTIEFLSKAGKERRKLGRTAAAGIIKTLEQRIAVPDARACRAARWRENHVRYWRWRIGEYCVVARIEDERVLILVVRVAHRREVYR